MDVGGFWNSNGLVVDFFRGVGVRKVRRIDY